MQAEIKELEEKSFRKFELVIKVESELELSSLWHRMNAEPDVFKSQSAHQESYPDRRLLSDTTIVRCTDIFSLLNEKVKEFGLFND